MSQILDTWKEIQVLVDQVELDVAKSDNGIAVAGIRMRKGLRTLRKLIATLGRESVIRDKEIRATRVTKRKPMTQEQKDAKAAALRASRKAKESQTKEG
jgi:hypothetical protein